MNIMLLTIQLYHGSLCFIFFIFFRLFSIILFVFVYFHPLSPAFAKDKKQIIQIHKQIYRSNFFYCTFAKNNNNCSFCAIAVYASNSKVLFFFVPNRIIALLLRFCNTFSAAQCKSNLFICLKKKGQMGKTGRIIKHLSYTNIVFS